MASYASSSIWTALMVGGCARHPPASMSRPSDAEPQTVADSEFASPELIRLWGSALRGARIRAVKPQDRARQLADDLKIAQFVLASSDSRLTRWVTTPQVIASAEVLIAHDMLGDQDCLYLLRWLMKSAPDSRSDLRRVIADGGPAMVRRAVMERQLLGDEMTIGLLYELGRSNDTALAELLAIAHDENLPPESRAWSIELLAGATIAPEPLRLPAGTVDALQQLSGSSTPAIADAAATTLDRLQRHFIEPMAGVDRRRRGQPRLVCRQ